MVNETSSNTKEDFAGLLSLGQKTLSGAGVEDAPRDALVLLCAAAGFDRAMLVSRSRENPPAAIKDKYIAYIYRRAQKEPIQYIIGEWEFMGLPFAVNHDALIPRPETESLVEGVINGLGDRAAPIILDMCTGSGCIAISLAVFLKTSSIVATDISVRALRLAEKNALLNNVSDRIMFLEGDLFDPLDEAAHFDAICANPPYIAKHEFATLPDDIRLYEPDVALDGGRDGLVFFRAIAGKAAKWLKPGGFIAVEVGAGQSHRVENIFKENGFGNTWAHTDAGGCVRVICGKIIVN